MKKGILYFFVCLSIFPIAANASRSWRVSVQGEGTGHHKVIQILGYSFPKSRVILNYEANYRRLGQISLSRICMVVLKNKEVYSLRDIEEFYLRGEGQNFNNLESFLVYNGGMYERDEILAIILKQ